MPSIVVAVADVDVAVGGAKLKTFSDFVKPVLLFALSKYSVN